MRRLRHYVSFSIISLFIFFSSPRAQERKPFSGDFLGLRFEEFIPKIESITGYHFYYDITELDSFIIHENAHELVLNEFLEKIFQNTPFRFSIDEPNRNVYITKRSFIQTELSPGFFKRGIEEKDTLRENNIVFEPEVTGKEKLRSTIENKLFEIGSKTNNTLKGNATVAGYIRDIKNGEAITGVAIYTDSNSSGVITDQFGYYSLTMPKGRHVLHVSGAGMKESKRQLMVYTDGKLNIELEEFIPSLRAVIVIAEKHSNIKTLQMGIDKLSIKTIKQVPVVLGEADILRVVLTLPGVVSVGEGSTGFNVRGGSADQNLILFNDATIYNPSHLFGFFSAFNADVIKGVELYKSGIPEKYGGRLSSVLDVTTRDGNSKKISGIGGIGLLTSKITIEGPILKDRTTFITSARTTYSNWILKQLDAYKNSRASFSDFDIHINHTINNKNNLYLTGYLSNDQFRLNSDSLYKYGNRNLNLKWKHIFNNKFYGVFTAGFDHYQYSVASGQSTIKSYRLAFDINQANSRLDFSYSPGNKHQFNFGVNSIYYKLNPGSFKPLDTHSLVTPDVLSAEQGLESAIYAGDRYAINPDLAVNVGLRYSLFNYLGPHDLYQYIDGLPRKANTIIDTLKYSSGKNIKSYHGPEFRLALRYSLSENASVKMSYNSLRQYIHMLSNTTAISPTDVWKLSDPNIRPQTGYQLSLGFYRNFKSNTIESSIEVYYKNMRNFLDYKSGAILIMNHHIETDVINSRGKAYGAELLVKKSTGKLNGWVSYTYSRTFLKMDDSLAGESINHGKYYPASFDKPHNLNLIGNYRFSHRYSISMNVIYNTGRPITLPIALFYFGGSQRVFYSERNQYRIPDYFRVDFSLNIDGNHKIKQLTHNSWSFGIYNLTARQNAYSVYFIQQGGIIKGYKLSVFGTAIPFVTYNFRF